MKKRIESPQEDLAASSYPEKVPIIFSPQKDPAEKKRKYI